MQITIENIITQLNRLKAEQDSEETAMCFEVAAEIVKSAARAAGANNKIKKCPLCGGKADVNLRVEEKQLKVWIECTECGAQSGGVYPQLCLSRTSVRSIETAKEKVVDMWNTRIQEAVNGRIRN